MVFFYKMIINFEGNTYIVNKLDYETDNSLILEVGYSKTKTFKSR